jgi:hypothetical protein
MILIRVSGAHQSGKRPRVIQANRRSGFSIFDFGFLIVLCPLSLVLCGWQTSANLTDEFLSSARSGTGLIAGMTENRTLKTEN